VKILAPIGKSSLTDAPPTKRSQSGFSGTYISLGYAVCSAPPHDQAETPMSGKSSHSMPLSSAEPCSETSGPMTMQRLATGDPVLPPVPWPRLFADRARSMRGSPIRELQELSLKPGIISFAGGMPAEELFPIDEFGNACERVLRAHGSRALQYGTTDGVAALREAIAYRASHHGLRVGAQNVLVTTGAQQALDLIGRILIDRVEKLRQAYTERRDAMLEAMAVSFPTAVTWTTPAVFVC
jgi:hypothetical protein